MAAANSILSVELSSADYLRQEEVSSYSVNLAAQANQAGLEWVCNEERMASHQGWSDSIGLYAI